MVPILLLFVTIAGQGASGDGRGFFGKWRGESVCVDRNSACHDESVVFRISNSAGSEEAFAVQASKIVDGHEIDMGTLRFRWDAAEAKIICDYPQGVWKIAASGEGLEGTLTRHDGTLFRHLALKKAAPGQK